MEVAGFTADSNSPSSRFRIRQYIPALAKEGIHVYDHPSTSTALVRKVLLRAKRRLLPLLTSKAMPCRTARLKSPGVDLLWLSRDVFPLGLLRMRIPKVLDFDDAVFLLQKHYDIIVRNVDIVVAGNEYLAEYARRYNSNVKIVPTCLDVQRFSDGFFPEDTFVIVWTGLSGNLPYLYTIEEPLDIFLREHPDSTLRICCNKPPLFTTIDPSRIDFVPWSPTSEIEALQDAHAGLMPLPDNPWTRGKCSFKMLQYMAMEKPCIVSPVGMNVDVLRQGRVGFSALEPADWRQALESLYVDRTLMHEMGREGRELVKSKFSLESAATRLTRIMKDSISFR